MKGVSLFFKFITMFRLSLLVLLFVFTGCNQIQTHRENRDVQHVVFIWLKDSSVENRQRIMKSSAALYEIQELETMSMGPALPSDRDIVDDSFDIGYVMTFKDKEAMERYLVHPIHKKLVEEVLKPALKKLVVYDID